MIRVGIGYDSHRFQPPGPLILGGIRIPFDNHLQGHSDGDVVCHALIDAILGAAAAGDIGEMFSDRDPRNLGRDSTEMLALVVKHVAAMGFRLTHTDVTIVTESPRLAEHRPKMRARLATVLGVDQSAVSIKAKTNEGLGWIGRGEGMACHAVATIAAE